MPTPVEIQRKANNIDIQIDKFKGASNRCYENTIYSSTWWQGDTGNLLRNEYKEIKADIARLISRKEKLQNLTNKLSSQVQRAEEERRQKAEEMKRLALITQKR